MMTRANARQRWPDPRLAVVDLPGEGGLRPAGAARGPGRRPSPRLWSGVWPARRDSTRSATSYGQGSSCLSCGELKCRVSREVGRSGRLRTGGRLRAWDGSQYRAFEELCFQVRDPAPPGWRTIKTGNPDGGVEWSDRAPDGRVHGSQAKFVGAVDELIPLARDSVRTVGANRGFWNVVKLTFFAPFDMPEPAPQTRSGRQQQGARQRWNDAVQRWKNDLPGVADIEIDFVGSGELLERLSRPGNEGRRWFFLQRACPGFAVVCGQVRDRTAGGTGPVRPATPRRDLSWSRCR